MLLGPNSARQQLLPEADGKVALAFLAGSVRALRVRHAIARWSRQRGCRGIVAARSREPHDGRNEMPLTVTAVATYGVGRLARSHHVAEVGCTGARR